MSEAPRPAWPPERVAAFQGHIAAGLSVRAAGRRVGATGSAACGKKARLDGKPTRRVPRPRKLELRPPAIYTARQCTSMDPEMLATLKAKADQRGVSVAALVRDYVEWGLENDG